MQSKIAVECSQLNNSYKLIYYRPKVCVPQAFMVLKVYLNPLWVLKVYSKQSCIKDKGFLPHLLSYNWHNWKLLNQHDTKKCIWYGRAKKSLCFCSVKCVVVKLVLKIESICCFCLEQFISLPLFIWVFCSSCCAQEKLPKQMFAFFGKFIIVIIIILDLMTLIMIISNVFFFRHV